MVFSVGGDYQEINVSGNVVKALKYAQSVEVYIGGIVCRDRGLTVQVNHSCVVVPTVSEHTVTPLA